MTDDRTQHEIERLDANGRALYVSKHLMKAEAALRMIIEEDIPIMRVNGDTPDLAVGYLGAMRGLRLIEAGHMELTEADLRVFHRPVPMSR